jgi:hypothetical protein
MEELNKFHKSCMICWKRKVLNWRKPTRKRIAIY